MELLLFDTHVHIYPEYDLAYLLKQAVINFSVYGNTKYNVLCLTDRQGFDTVKILKEKKIDFINIDDLLIKILPPNPQIYLLLGKQILTREKIEVLGIGLREQIEDRLPIDAVINQIISYSALPVLPWGLGKWFFQRGDIISEIFTRRKDVLIGDIRQRFFRSRLLAKFSPSHNLLAGSDPLPFHGEEKVVGKLATGFILDKLPATFNSDFCKDTLKGIYGRGVVKGERDSFFNCLRRRYLRNYVNAKQ